MKHIENSNSLHRFKKTKVVNKTNIIRASVLFIAALFIFGYMYESSEARKYVGAAPGKSITVNGISYNYDATAGKGYKIIVAGAAGESMLSRKALTEAFGEDNKLFFFDRPGYGSTDGDAKSPKELAEDLHFMFRKFGWTSGYILIGEEFGSLVMQEFINMYPDEVLGAIMINPVGPALGSETMDTYIEDSKEGIEEIRTLGTFGIPRILSKAGVARFNREVDIDSDADLDFYSNLWLTNAHLKAFEAELSEMAALDAIEAVDGALGVRPVYLMTTNRHLQDMKQSEILSYSSDQETVIVSDSVKEILLERSEEVISTLNGLMKKLKRIDL